MSCLEWLLRHYRSPRKSWKLRRRLTLEALEDRTLPAVDIVMQWNQFALATIQNDFSSAGLPVDEPGPTKGSRALAIVQAAVYDAAVAVDPIYTPYAPAGPLAQLFSTPPAAPGTSITAAVSQAAHDTLAALFPHQSATFDAELTVSLAGLPTGPAELGEQLGATIAADMLGTRASDGSNVNPPYTPGAQPGDWQPDPLHPAQAPVGVGWGSVTPFTIQSPALYQAPPPPALGSPEYTAAFNYLKAIGGDGVLTPTIRTPEQTLIGNFWSYDGSPGIGTPPVAYNQIVEVIAQQQGNSLMQNARLFALVNLAMADAGIAAWYTKYTFNFWRPVTAIRDGGTDGNPNTQGDPNWTPLGGAMDNGNPNGPYYTPAFPAYTSGHAAFGAAMFQVVANFYGTNNISFNWTSDEYDRHTVDQYGFTRPEVTRHYDTLSQAMYENAQSRLYLGIHWPWDRDAGMVQGTEIGDFTFQHFLLPVNNSQTPNVVTLPLTPQQGTFASLGDAIRGISFEVTENVVLMLKLLGSFTGSSTGLPGSAIPSCPGGAATCTGGTGGSASNFSVLASYFFAAQGRWTGSNQESTSPFLDDLNNVGFFPLDGMD
jgi:PAP2 superfamily